MKAHTHTTKRAHTHTTKRAHTHTTKRAHTHTTKRAHTHTTTKAHTHTTKRAHTHTTKRAHTHHYARTHIPLRKRTLAIETTRRREHVLCIHPGPLRRIEFEHGLGAGKGQHVHEMPPSVRLSYVGEAADVELSRVVTSQSVSQHFHEFIFILRVIR